MKRFLFLALTLISTAGFAQFSDKVIESKYYQVFFQSDEQEAAVVAQKLDSLFDFYNSYFHFDTSHMTERLKVKLLDSKSAYIDYVSATTTVSDPVSSFLFVQYQDSTKSELIGYKNDNPDFEDTLSHYSFIQFFRNFITNPPLWLEKGFAVYFGKSFYSPVKNAVVYKENLTWLNTLKSYLDADPPALIDLNTLFSMDSAEVSENSDLFYAQSWGLIKFLIENQQAVYNRVIWDSVNKLTRDASKEENEENAKRPFVWLNATRFSKDFYEYITALKTFPQLVDNGIALYEEGKYNEAKIPLIKAITMEDKNYIPYYYLGLIHYNTEDYSAAIPLIFLAIGNMILAGVSISLGAYIYLKVGGIIGAIMFSIGLISVIHFRFGLYTVWVKNFKHWDDSFILLIILLLNIVGCLLMSLAISDQQIIQQCNDIVSNRADMGFWRSIFNGAGCGFIITLSVMCKNRIALLIGIPAFILAGFTHSIADAFYYCVGHSSIDGAAMLSYLGTVIGNFIGGIIFKAGSTVR